MKSEGNSKEFVVFCEEKYGLEGNTHQHIIDALSVKSKVYFIGPILPFKINNVFKKCKLKRLANNVFEFNYYNFIPNIFQRSFIGKITSSINDFINEKRFIKESGKTKRDIIYFDPTKGISFHGDKKYYYVLDPYFNRTLDKLFAQKSDEIIVVNSEMGTKYQYVNNKIIVVPHGIPQIDVNQKESDFLKNKYGSFALLMGTISDLIDFELLLKLANMYPQTNFVIIGKTNQMSDSNSNLFKDLLKKNNVFYDGLINYKDIDNYIDASSICLIIYHAEKFKYKNPIKITNYLAHSKLILNTFKLVDLNTLENKILFTANKHDDFLYLFEDFLKETLYIDENFVDYYCKKYSYDKLVDNLFYKSNLK